VNGGSAALRAIRRRAQPMPTQLWFTPSISYQGEALGTKKRRNGGAGWPV